MPLVGITNNINAGLYQHMHFKYNSYSHNILGHHNVIQVFNTDS